MLGLVLTKVLVVVPFY